MTKPLSKRQPELPPTTDENEVLRRMLHTPPTPHKPRTAPATKTTKVNKKAEHGR